MTLQVLFLSFFNVNVDFVSHIKKIKQMGKNEGLLSRKFLHTIVSNLFLLKYYYAFYK